MIIIVSLCVDGLCSALLETCLRVALRRESLVHVSTEPFLSLFPLSFYMYLPVSLSVCLSVVCMSVTLCLSAGLSLFLPACLSVCPPARLLVLISRPLSLSLSIWDKVLAGSNVIVVHVAVAVLLCLKRRLLGASSTGEIARILQNVGQHSILLNSIVMSLKLR